MVSHSPYYPPYYPLYYYSLYFIILAHTYPITSFAIMLIVRNNPQVLTLHFGRPRGKAIRQNYMSITLESIDVHVSANSEKIFKDATETTTSYTYRSSTSLLSFTLFTDRAHSYGEVPF